MTCKPVLLLGASGQVGQALRSSLLPSDWELFSPSRKDCDISDVASLRETMQTIKPFLVINAAAMTAVDLCEKEKDLANKINFDAPAHLAAQCAGQEALLIHLSTDYVFDGKDGDVPYRPDQAMNPLNVYGASKMMGEEAIRHELPWHVILRVSSVFSAFNSNILTKALTMIDGRDELKIVNDQKACPTYAPEIAKAVVEIASELLNGKANGFGTFHLCGQPVATRFEFVNAIINIYSSYSSRLPKLLPASSKDFPGLAERPGYSVLDCAKIFNVYGIQQKPWQDGLIEAIPLLVKNKGQAA